MCLNDLINEIWNELEYGPTPLDNIFDIRPIEINGKWVHDVLSRVKEQINEITIVEACRVLNMDYRHVVNEYCGEKIYE